jgi:hypothetical protein
MRRREFITALLFAAAISPARAQRSAKVYHVAIASPTPLLPEYYRVFLEELRRSSAMPLNGALFMIPSLPAMWFAATRM